MVKYLLSYLLRYSAYMQIIMLWQNKLLTLYEDILSDHPTDLFYYATGIVHWKGYTREWLIRQTKSSIILEINAKTKTFSTWQCSKRFVSKSRTFKNTASLFIEAL